MSGRLKQLQRPLNRKQAESLTWAGFVLRNLVPVTIGNVAGGTLLVGAVYWFVYLRPRRTVNDSD